MKKITLILFLLTLISFVSFAQKTIEKVKNAPLHAGESRSFAASFKDLVKFSRDAMVDAGLELESVEKVDEDTYMLIGKTRASGWSWGELVRVVVLQEDNNQKNTVRVYTKKRVGMNVTAKGSYTNTIFSNIEAKIELGED
jgi:hypothetical protein